ncbi:voltage-dependent calcium channel subunit alpha-2/delta-3 [Apis florea]|uniref:voltage-dependent calcium channel subunit alpha-2/delta-3 n=1 Tax=Apis florea TaxID=7463 RepID=UPI0012FED5A4|nr:voltage-dependent calcium channel subunit alpha-2/delta-3 [Apis florea]
MFLSVKKFVHCGVLLLLWIKSSYQQEEDIPHNEVKNWALKFGVDLWEFGRQVTKMSEIQRKYHDMEAEVVKKDGVLLVREMAAEVKNMLDFKMNAVMRLVESAEQAAVSAPRDGNVAPKYYASQRFDSSSGEGKASITGQETFLSSNRHFDHLPVNITLSTVLLPDGVKQIDREVAAGIQWSEYLDLLFANNYESDSSLSWQYYGATSGFLRRFPAISWPPANDRAFGADKNRPIRDVYEFRISDWFVGAANSPKDLAILIDMECYVSERNKRLAVTTVKTILDTLGPNDYVNVYRYGDTAEEIVQCFKDSLVQASPENVQDLKIAMSSVKHEETPTNISAALATAFEILHRYNRTGQGSQCNQAIMLITADNAGLPTEVIKRYNWPHMPVRIFTYLIGGDKSPELRNTACANKGFYARITELEDIRSKVFEYVKVLARPMVLYQHEHPIHWSPVYVGGKSSRYGKENIGQLMTSVTAPILDRRNYTVKTANLLGIVGTDVPVEEIQKLVPPYKLGVNGYSFIVDNNGRVLYHPDLRPLPGNVDYEETLKPTYISVDLSEVELAEYDGPLHPLNNSLLLDVSSSRFILFRRSVVNNIARNICFDTAYLCSQMAKKREEKRNERNAVFYRIFLLHFILCVSTASPIAILMALLHSQGTSTFGVTRSFIATRSGLFRWHEHQQTEDNTDESPFAEKYARAMDSSWYKRAVDQHSIEPDSFVFSVPFNAADSPNPLVTATHAVFIGTGHKAPAAVVGLQFQHSSLASRFVNITSTCSGTSCKKNCASDALDCYILDNNGFIIISERHEHTGKFFGEIDGTIMDSLVQDRIYRKVTVTDYQGICSPQESHQSSASRIFTESVAKTIAILGNFLWSMAFGFNFQNLWQVAFAFAGESVRPLDDTIGQVHEFESLPVDVGGEEATDEPVSDGNFPRLPPTITAATPASPGTTRATSAHHLRTRLRSCEKKTDLYILQPERLNTSGQSNPLKGKLTNCHDTGCERPFSVQKIPHTNLILLVVDTLCPCGSKQLSIEPIEALTEPGACIARRERLYRRRPPKCINYHPEEMEIKFCGSANRPCHFFFLFIIAIVSSTLA